MNNGDDCRLLQLHITAAQYRFLKMLAALVERKAWEFRWHYGEDGMLEFKGKLPPEQGAVFLKAIDLVLRSLHNDPDKVAVAEKPAAVEDLPTKDAKGDFVFHHADGQQLRQAIYPQFIDEVDFLVESLAIENEHQAMGMEITSRTAVTEWQGEVMDYGLAVGTLLSIEEQRLRVAG